MHPGDSGTQMSEVMTDPLIQTLEPEKHRQQSRDGYHSRSERRPFDDSELEELPRARSDDPPYQDWWVIDARTDRIKL